MGPISTLGKTLGSFWRSCRVDQSHYIIHWLQASTHMPRPSCQATATRKPLTPFSLALPTSTKASIFVTEEAFDIIIEGRSRIKRCVRPALPCFPAGGTETPDIGKHQKLTDLNDIAQ